ncbi:MAG: hypothetical protein JST00_04770 [Deltaproteobacteria bacterium]|nr:hypothetical protein [Deltaproteobacteria bacterium]
MGGKTWTSVATIVVVGGSGACAGAPEAARAPEAAHVSIVRTPGKMNRVEPTRMGDALAAAGLDPRALPPLEALEMGPKQRVMRTFSTALGIPCLGCHAESDFAADTRRKRVAKRMWNELVRVLEMRDGAPIYCDSCHDGSLFALDRRDTTHVADFMSDVLVGRLRRIDGRPHDCTTCHDDPPDFHTITTWKQTPAPDIVLRSGAFVRGGEGARAPLPKPEDIRGPILVPRLPTPEARNPEDCGAQSSLCPLDRWMRLGVAVADAANDGPALAAALERVARFSPSPSWRWEAIAAEGAAAARDGDLARARQSCGSCHAAYKTPWRALHRTRAVP